MNFADQRPVTVYRALDSSGILLYVGVTCNFRPRMKQHQKEKAWWKDVARVAIETYPTRKLALDAEARIIRTEDPVFNVRMNRAHFPANSLQRLAA